MIERIKEEPLGSNIQARSAKALADKIAQYEHWHLLDFKGDDSPCQHQHYLSYSLCEGCPFNLNDGSTFCELNPRHNPNLPHALRTLKKRYPELFI